MNKIRYIVLVTFVLISLLGLGIVPGISSPEVAHASASQTFYPNAHTESTSVDGVVGYGSQNVVWATISGGAGSLFIAQTAGAATNSAFFAGDVELDSKPTWAY